MKRRIAPSFQEIAASPFRRTDWRNSFSIVIQSHSSPPKTPTNPTGASRSPKSIIQPPRRSADSALSTTTLLAIFLYLSVVTVVVRCQLSSPGRGESFSRSSMWDLYQSHTVTQPFCRVQIAARPRTIIGDRNPHRRQVTPAVIAASARAVGCLPPERSTHHPRSPLSAIQPRPAGARALSSRGHTSTRSSATRSRTMSGSPLQHLA